MVISTIICLRGECRGCCPEVHFQGSLGTVVVETTDQQGTGSGLIEGVMGKTSPYHIILRPEKSTISNSFICVKHSCLPVGLLYQVYTSGNNNALTHKYLNAN